MDRSQCGRWCLAAVLLGGLPLWAAEPSSPEQTALQQLLQAGEQRGPVAVTEAKRRFESARSLSSDDRPVRYAYGVVLARLLKSKEALAEFQSAATSERGPYPPAVRAMILLELTGRDWKVAATSVRRFGETLVNHPEAWETDTAWSADARWLGESVSAGQLLVATAADVKIWSELDQHLRSSLPAAVRTEYIAGFDAILERHTTLSAKVEEVQQEAVAAETAKNEAIRKEVLDAQQRVTAEKENLKVAADDWKKLYDDQMAELGKQLGKLEKDWTTLDTRRQSLERSILITQQEISLMLQQLEQINSQSNNQKSRNNNQVTFGTNLQQTFNQQLGQRQAALIQYQFDWNRTVGQQNQVQQQAVGFLNQRQAAVADYQQRTGQLTQQDGQLDKWNGRLNKQAKELEEPATGKTAQTRTLQQKLKSVGTYIPWDWEAERLRLLAESIGESPASTEAP